MRFVKTKSGYIAYSASRNEVATLGGYGICDFCNKTDESGYLVPVLNQWLCPSCFEKWDAQAKYYPEDLNIEDRNAQYYERVLTLEGGAKEWTTPNTSGLLSNI